METIIKKITDNEIENDKIIKTAAEIISRGGLVAFPTETVYGLGGDSFDPAAAEKIYAAKGRPSDNPLIVHISEFDDIYKLSDEVPEIAKVLADKFWPGPLTMIVKKNKSVPVTVTGGIDTVAVRLPSHKVARKLIKESGTFIEALMTGVKGNVKPKAPGMKYRHYAPKAELTIIEGSPEKTVARIEELVKEAERKGQKAGIMLSEENFDKICSDYKLCLGSSSDENEIARNLFACLRKFDDMDIDVIFSEGFSEEGIGQAIMNRLLKAAGHKIIEV